jgi:hypothetical protein
MHFSRLSSLLFLIPVCVVAQTTQRPRYVCFTPQPQAPQPLPLGNTPFPHPVLFQRPSFPQDRINLAHIIPPQEFHVPTLTMVDAEKSACYFLICSAANAFTLMRRGDFTEGSRVVVVRDQFGWRPIQTRFWLEWGISPVYKSWKFRVLLKADS